MKKTSAKAFTLIELSIVVVIIGLIVAGVVAGQSLVRQAGLRMVLSDVEKYKTAVNSFKLQYGNKVSPGDMANAESYFGASNTNNGNGNGLVEWPVAEEPYLFWQHLQLAGLVSGSFTGAGTTGDEAQAGVNVPAASISSAGFGVRGANQIGAGIHLKPPSPGEFFIVGGFRANADQSNSAFVPSEIYALDLKTDDGLSESGKIMGTIGADGGAGTNCEDGTSAYNLTQTVKRCVLVIITDL